MFFGQLGKVLLIYVRPTRTIERGVHLDRKTAIDLVKELGELELVQPVLVVIENRTPDKNQLKIKGNYDCKQVEMFLKDRGFSYEENKDYLIIFKA